MWYVIHMNNTTTTHFEVKHLDKGRYRWAIVADGRIVDVMKTRKVAERFVSNNIVKRELGFADYIADYYATKDEMRFSESLNMWI